MISLSTGRFLHTLLMLTALVASYLLYKRGRRKLSVSDDHKRFLSLAALIGAFIGAKLPFLIDQDWSGLSPWVHWLSDGKTVLGGIFGGYISVELTKAWLGVRQGTGDAFALPIAAGLSIGRIGCFFGGCCYGLPTQLPWGVAFRTAPDGGQLMRHPIQIYESLFHLLGLVVLWRIEQQNRFTGQRLKLYLLGYLVFRFLTETIRPEPVLYANLTAYQFACIGLAILLLTQFFWQLKRNRSI
ncbi:MAG: prolipoprotein diacylglyceryl transferase [Planctomycetes bacterium]|nr:prolipoprotein diacylglyceryl transferase [Planctomycetota bacterium]